MRAAIVGAFAIAALYSAPVALADPDSEEKAREHFEEATRRFEGGNLAGALAEYRAAYDLVPRAKILLNIGGVLLEMGRKAEAADHFDRYLDDPDADPERLAKVREVLADLDRHLGKMTVRVRTEAGTVRLDETALGNAPLEVTRRVAPGTHTLVVENPDGSGTSQRVEVAAGQTLEVVIPIPTAPRAPPDRGFVSPTPGRPERDDRRRGSIFGRPWFWTGIAATALAGTGVAFGLSARSLERDIERLNEESADHPFSDTLAIEDRARSRALWANLGFGAAGAMAIATTLLIIRDLRKGDRDTAQPGKTETSVRVVPGGGIVVVEVPFP